MRRLTQEQFVSKLYDISPDITVIGEYINNRTKILVSDNIGCFYYVKANSLLNGKKPSITSSADKTINFVLKAKSKNKNYINYDSAVYVDKNTDVILYDEFGFKHLMKPPCVFSGSALTIASVCDKTEFFEYKSNLIHNGKYDYSLFKYSNQRQFIDIICKEHGIFNQVASSHLHGRGCEKCALESEFFRYTKTHWIASSIKSSNFDGFKVYVIECYNDTERFFKIGRTYNTVKRRYASNSSMPYRYNIVSTITSSSGDYIYDTENRLLRLNSSNKYNPDISFGGETECFSVINYK